MATTNNTFNYHLFVTQSFYHHRPFILNGVTYYYINTCKDYNEEMVTFTDGTQRMETVSYGIVVAYNIRRGKIVALDLRKYGEKEVTLLK